MSDLDNARDRVAGTAKKVAGRASGDKDLEAEGTVQDTEAKIRQKLDNVSEGARDAAEDIAATARAAAERVRRRVSGSDDVHGTDPHEHHH